jgi:dedicator of cytokinesis protein 3
MPVYLQKREYRVFDIVHQHIDALHMGRRQLLAQTLSVEETALLKKECVARLVKGNVAQGLEVIVRHPVNGGLVVVDPEAAREDMDGWLTAVRMYAMQVAVSAIS